MKIAAVITAKTLEEALSDIKSAEGADLIELRLDYLTSIDYGLLKKIIDRSKERKVSVLVTNRKESEGGNFIGSEEERLKILKTAADKLSYINSA